MLSLLYSIACKMSPGFPGQNYDARKRRSSWAEEDRRITKACIFNGLSIFTRVVFARTMLLAGIIVLEDQVMGRALRRLFSDFTWHVEAKWGRTMCL
jgi:hypothetical protein